MEHRAVIEQAKGVLMATMGCRPDAAFAELAARSMNQNRKVRDIAGAECNGLLGFLRADGPDGSGSRRLSHEHFVRSEERPWFHDWRT
jgi:hypothetical protein